MNKRSIDMRARCSGFDVSSLAGFGVRDHLGTCLITPVILRVWELPFFCCTCLQEFFSRNSPRLLIHATKNPSASFRLLLIWMLLSSTMNIQVAAEAFVLIPSICTKTGGVGRTIRTIDVMEIQCIAAVLYWLERRHSDCACKSLVSTVLAMTTRTGRRTEPIVVRQIVQLGFYVVSCD